MAFKEKAQSVKCDLIKIHLFYRGVFSFFSYHPSDIDVFLWRHTWHFELSPSKCQDVEMWLYINLSLVVLSLLELSALIFNCKLKPQANCNVYVNLCVCDCLSVCVCVCVCLYVCLSVCVCVYGCVSYIITAMVN